MMQKVKIAYCFLESSIKFQGHTGWKIDEFNPIWVRLLGRSQLSNPSDLPCFHKAAVDDKAALVYVMSWCWVGNRPLPEPMMTQFTDAYIQHSCLMYSIKIQATLYHTNIKPNYLMLTIEFITLIHKCFTLSRPISYEEKDKTGKQYQEIVYFWGLTPHLYCPLLKGKGAH